MSKRKAAWERAAERIVVIEQDYKQTLERIVAHLRQTEKQRTVQVKLAQTNPSAVKALRTAPPNVVREWKNVVMPFGKARGVCLGDVLKHDPKYLRWLLTAELASHIRTAVAGLYAVHKDKVDRAGPPSDIAWMEKVDREDWALDPFGRPPVYGEDDEDDDDGVGQGQISLKDRTLRLSL